jgi:hypothetical protein
VEGTGVLSRHPPPITRHANAMIDTPRGWRWRAAAGCLLDLLVTAAVLAATMWLCFGRILP